MRIEAPEAARRGSMPPPFPLLAFPSPAALAAASAPHWAAGASLDILPMLVDEVEAEVAAPASAAVAPPPPPPAARTRVRFATGPLPHTPDGHPQGDGRTVPARLAPSRLGLVPAWTLKGNPHPPEPLTLHNLRLLAAELGPENAASITRLRRRAGLEPPLVRPPPPGKG